jgi:hypothetical protein
LQADISTRRRRLKEQKLNSFCAPRILAFFVEQIKLSP